MVHGLLTHLLHVMFPPPQLLETPSLLISSIFCAWKPSIQLLIRSITVTCLHSIQKDFSPAKGLVGCQFKKPCRLLEGVCVIFSFTVYLFDRKVFQQLFKCLKVMQFLKRYCYLLCKKKLRRRGIFGRCREYEQIKETLTCLYFGGVVVCNKMVY